MAGDDNIFDGEEDFESAMGSDEVLDTGPMEMGATPAARPAQPHRPASRPMTHQNRFGGVRSPTTVPATVVIQTQSDPAMDGPRKRFRTRPMPPKLRVRWPDVSSMLLTNNDGSQILFLAGLKP